MPHSRASEAGVGEVIAFPGSPRVQEGTTRRLLFAGVEEHLTDSDLPPTPVAMDDELSVLYVAELTIRRDGLKPDLWIEQPERSAFDRTIVLTTLAGDVLEQDGTGGRLWLNGCAYLDGALVDAAVIDDGRPAVRLGATVALMCMRREVDRCVISVGVLGPVLWLFAHLSPLSPTPVLEGWRTIARELWLGRKA